MNKITKKVYLDKKYHIGDERWRFFAYTKIGEWLCDTTYNLSQKYSSNKFFKELHGFCLPF